MEIICKRLKPYVCQKCGQEMLFFYTKNGTLIDYKTLFVKGYNLFDIRKYLEHKGVKYIKCITCNKLYIIDWSTGYPVPLLDNECLKNFGI